jgi:hypothetical protein
MHRNSLLGVAMNNEFLVVVRYKTNTMVYRDFSGYEAANLWFIKTRTSENVEWAEFLRSTPEGMLRMCYFVPVPKYDPNKPVSPIVQAFRAAREEANHAKSI